MTERPRMRIVLPDDWTRSASAFGSPRGYAAGDPVNVVNPKAR